MNWEERSGDLRMMKTERTLQDAMARAEIKIAKVRGGVPVHVDEMDIAILAEEVKRLKCTARTGASEDED